MAPSPSSSLNTPGGAGAVASPSCNQQEDQAYRDKVRQLSKYIEPLRRMINKMGNDGDSKFWVILLKNLIFLIYIFDISDVEKLSKMKKLLEILSNPSKRVPLETLIKCEIVLEKLDFKRVCFPTSLYKFKYLLLKVFDIIVIFYSIISNYFLIKFRVRGVGL